MKKGASIKKSESLSLATPRSPIDPGSTYLWKRSLLL